jgi:hypothetical protein
MAFDCEHVRGQGLTISVQFRPNEVTSGWHIAGWYAKQELKHPIRESVKAHISATAH